MTIGNFKFQPRVVAAGAPVSRLAGAPPPPPARPPLRVSRWAGVQSAAARNPIIGEGVYRVRVVGCEQGYNPGKGTESFKADIEVVSAEPGSANAVGAQCVVIEQLSGKAMQAGMGRTKAFIVAAAGFADDAEFDAFSPDGAYIDAILGVANAFAGATLAGRLVDVFVQRGNTVLRDGQPTDDYYRVYTWAVVPEAEQDQAASPGAAA